MQSRDLRYMTMKKQKVAMKEQDTQEPRSKRNRQAKLMNEKKRESL